MRKKKLIKIIRRWSLNRRLVDWLEMLSKFKEIEAVVSESFRGISFLGGNLEVGPCGL